MKIAVLGAGNIGGTIGKAWQNTGHAVVFGVRRVEKYQAQDPDGTYDSIANAIQHGDIILFATPSSAVEAIVTDHKAALDGNVIIDASNDFSQTVMNKLDIFQSQTPNATLIRAFNNLGWENFANPQINGEKVCLYYVGQTGDGKQKVHQLIADVGLEPIDVGGLDNAYIVDNLTRLWFALTIQQDKSRRLFLKPIREE